MQISQSTFNYTGNSNYYKDGNKEYTTDEKKENSDSQNELSQDEQRVVYELQARDTEVRAHEAAHQAAGGGMTGGANYSYQRGPDGKMYAIGGEVSISMPSGSTPEELISNAQQVIASAMAPANPSAQDMSIASSARAIMIEAQQEKAKEAYETQSQTDEEKSENDPSTKLDISA
ncbi:MAG: putative metalloprotease CJM1_0395 family protein [Thiovulaceae bacterium]|nr:putative metalloprotease CJM1_0395 family protein [Sulfurimonadaceae bacterium]